MPIPYRAPEIILGMEWGKSIDYWSIGLLVSDILPDQHSPYSPYSPQANFRLTAVDRNQAWDLLEKEPIFTVYHRESPELNDAHHLAAMTSLLGPPPVEFLQRSNQTQKYWDMKGEH